jgi:GntR family transcriptional regulator
MEQIDKETNDPGLNLDYNSFEPLYHQLKVKIKTEIEKGLWQLGSCIPSEKELCDTYKISRPTVRQALQELVREGLLNRKKGKGTFVVQPEVEQLMEDVYGFTEIIMKQGLVPSSIILKQELIDQTPEIAGSLNLAKSEKVVFIERIRMADSKPVILDRAYFGSNLFPALESMDVSGSIYKIVRENFNYILGNARETIELATVDKSIANCLGLSIGTPIFFKKRITYTNNAIPLEYCEQYIRGDKCRFIIELHNNVQLDIK